MYSFLAIGLLFSLLFGGRLNVVFILDYSSIGISSDDSWVVHETSSFESSFFSVFGPDCCYFGLG